MSNLTNLYISQSFQRLLQASGSEFIVLDGTGSEALTLTVSGTNIIGFSSSIATRVVALELGSAASGGYWTGSADHINRESDVKITGSLYILGSVSGTDSGSFKNIRVSETASIAHVEGASPITFGSDIILEKHTLIANAITASMITGSFAGDGTGLFDIDHTISCSLQTITQLNTYGLHQFFLFDSGDYFKECIYNSISADLEKINYYDTPAKSLLIFDKQLIYSGSILSASVVTRYTDNAVLTKTFSYDNQGNLIDIFALESYL